MRQFLIIAMFPLLLTAQRFGGKELDDKTKHLVAGHIITSLAGTITYEITERPFFSTFVGFGAGTAAGILKEAVWDKRMNRGECNNFDAYDTIWGSLVSSLTVRVYIDFRQNKMLEKMNLMSEKTKINPFE